MLVQGEKVVDVVPGLGCEQTSDFTAVGGRVGTYTHLAKLVSDVSSQSQVGIPLIRDISDPSF